MNGKESPNTFTIRPAVPADKAWINELLTQRWGAPEIVSRGKIHNAVELPAFIAETDSQYSGLAIYIIEGDSCEMVTLNSLRQNIGIGTALVETVKSEAANNQCKRLWLITTNDNTPATRFYQKLGFRIAAIYPNAIEKSRELKPSIPLYGIDGIPVRDEIELEMLL
ncbi:MAG: GNAT family N-acetyltransferase [candidate division Zixibacteria bacterium]|nr:GNAT family N-acetyltransferase [candidate division Zixibacteria bacterium]